MPDIERLCEQRAASASRTARAPGSKVAVANRTWTDAKASQSLPIDSVRVHAIV